MQGSVLGKCNGGSEDGVVAIGDGVGVMVGGGGRRISTLHGEIEELEHESNGDSEDFWGKEEKRAVMLVTIEKMHFSMRI